MITKSDAFSSPLPQATKRQHIGNQIDAAFVFVFKLTAISRVEGLTIEENDPNEAARVAAILSRFWSSLQPQSSITVTEATEKDLIEATAQSPEVAADLEKLLRFLGTTPADAPPLRIEITNPEQLKPDKPGIRHIDVQRDGEGRLAGAVVTEAG